MRDMTLVANVVKFCKESLHAVSIIVIKTHEPGLEIPVALLILKLFHRIHSNYPINLPEGTYSLYS